MSTGYIYKFTSPKKRVYVGQTMNIENRIRLYKLMDCKSQPRLYRSFKKHGGFDGHKFEILTECDTSELNKMERYYQDLFSACGHHGLNCRLTGTSDRQGSLSEETKAKISASNKGKVRTPEMRLKVSQFHTGKRWNVGFKHTDEARQKMSESKKGIASWNKGIPMTETHKANMVAAKKGTNAGPDSVNNKIVFDTATGVYYFNAKDAAEFNNISYKLLSRYLTGNRRNKTSLIYA